MGASAMVSDPAADSAAPDVLAPTPLGHLRRWIGPARGYQLTRWLIVRLLAFVYVFAFLGLILQGGPLLGSHGLTPIGSYVDQLHAAGMTFWDVPSVLMLNSSDGAITAWAWLGFALSLAALAGYANLPSMLLVWAIYGSFVRVGQLWFSFGWEIQILETTLIAALMVHPWDPRPLRAPQPPQTAIVLMRWLAFRIMLGAGLIKLRGDACWTDLTCLDTHFETQPIPNPLSQWFHHAPHAVHAVGVVFNHIVELVAPWFVFGPRRARLVAGCAMAAFQIVLIVSGNLAFLNWLTLVPVLACFDDDFLLRLVPARLRVRLSTRLAAPRPRDPKQLASAFGIALGVIVLWQPIFGGLAAGTQVMLGCVLLAAALAWSARKRLDLNQLVVGAFAALVAVKSVDVIENLASKHQAMNTSYDRLDLVNTYGAFGSVGAVRYEIVIEGTRDADPEHATWKAYELPCKPGNVARRPCILGPYHRRLDWLIWFAAMNDQPRDPWVIHLVWKLLDGDREVRKLLAVDPFDGKPPTYVRIQRFVYHLAAPGADTWWTREDEQPWLPPVSLTTPGLRETLEDYGWPSPSVH